MNEIDGLLVLLSFPKPKANRSKKRRQFHDLFTFEGSCLIKTIHSYKTAWSTSGICSMFFAREENAITRKSQNQKHRPSTRRNKALQKRRQKYKASKKERDNQSHVSRKENDKAKTVWKTDVCQTWKTEGGPLNRRIKRYSILQRLNFGDSSCRFRRKPKRVQRCCIMLLFCCSSCGQCSEWQVIKSAKSARSEVKSLWQLHSSYMNPHLPRPCLV